VPLSHQHSPGDPRATTSLKSGALAIQLWVLRSTLALKTTDATLVSVDGNIGHRGALVPLPHASPDTITEETPSATVTPTQSRRSTFAIFQGCGKARPRS
jgi:hypothetical protein